MQGPSAKDLYNIDKQFRFPMMLSQKMQSSQEKQQHQYRMIPYQEVNEEDTAVRNCSEYDQACSDGDGVRQESGHAGRNDDENNPSSLLVSPENGEHVMNREVSPSSKPGTDVFNSTGNFGYHNCNNTLEFPQTQSKGHHH